MKSVVWMCFDADSVVEPVFQNEQRAQAKELTTTIVPSVGPKSKIPVRLNWSKLVFSLFLGFDSNQKTKKTNSTFESFKKQY